jgi:hypothetical protein
MLFQYRSCVYQILTTERRLAFPHAQIDIIESADGPFVAERNDHKLDYKLVRRCEKRPPVASSKDLETRPLWRTNPNMKRTPGANHPWMRNNQKLIALRRAQAREDISNLQDGDTTDLR